MADRGPGPDRVQLRDVIDDDLEIFFEHQSDAEATAMAAFPARDRAAHFAHWRKIMADDALIAQTILFDDEVAGNIGSWDQDGHREIGYWIGRSFWGKGIATSAVARFIDVLTYRPLYAWVAQHNTGSIRVLEKCGFTLSKEQPQPEPDQVRYVVLELRAIGLRPLGTGSKP